MSRREAWNINVKKQTTWPVSVCGNFSHVSITVGGITLSTGHPSPHCCSSPTHDGLFQVSTCRYFTEGFSLLITFRIFPFLSLMFLSKTCLSFHFLFILSFLIIHRYFSFHFLCSKLHNIIQLPQFIFAGTPRSPPQKENLHTCGVSYMGYSSTICLPRFSFKIALRCNECMEVIYRLVEFITHPVF